MAENKKNYGLPVVTEFKALALVRRQMYGSNRTYMLSFHVEISLKEVEFCHRRKAVLQGFCFVLFFIVFILFCFACFRRERVGVVCFLREIGF